ncbi:MAG: PatB family C-S lyase [Deinococcaceae bacterium]
MNKIHPYDTIDPNQLRRPENLKWTAYPNDVLPLWVADMDFPIASEIREALKKRMDIGLGYMPMGGDPKLIDALIWRWAQWGLELTPKHIHLLPGVVPGLFSGIKAFGQGHDVITHTPIYPPFLLAAKNHGGRCIENALQVSEQGYAIDWEMFESQITPETRLMLLCNPHNPTGRVWTYSELEKMTEIALRHNLIVLSDDLHADLDYTGQYRPIASLGKEISQRTVTLIGPCKTYNMAGLGIGAAVSENTALIEQIRQTGHGWVAHPTALAQTAWLTALEKGQNWLSETLDYLKGNRTFLQEFLTENIPEIRFFPPNGTYLAWLDFRSIWNTDVHSELLQHARVALSEGRTFGQQGAGFARLNFATSKPILREALERIQHAVKTYS